MTSALNWGVAKGRAGEIPALGHQHSMRLGQRFVQRSAPASRVRSAPPARRGQ